MTNIFRDTRLQLAVLVLVALLLRVDQLSSSLSYDEIWTLQNYSELPLSQIFTDLELPNNQPLNTVAVKILAFLLPIPAVVRLHSLLAGVGAGLFPSVGETCDRLIHTVQRIEPQPREIYRKQYRTYGALYSSLKQLFRA